MSKNPGESLRIVLHERDNERQKREEERAKRVRASFFKGYSPQFYFRTEVTGSVRKSKSIDDCPTYSETT